MLNMILRIVQNEVYLLVVPFIDDGEDNQDTYL